MAKKKGRSEDAPAEPQDSGSRAKSQTYVQHRLGAVVRRAHRRQETGQAQHHQPPAQPGSVRAAGPPGRETAEAAACQRLHRAETAVALYPGEVLRQRGAVAFHRLPPSDFC